MKKTGFALSLVSVLGLHTIAHGSSGTPWGINPHQPDSILQDTIKALGTDWMRCSFYWNQIQPFNSYSFDWSIHDPLAQRAQARGLNVLGVFVHTPQWASSCDTCSDYWRYPPSNSQYWYDFVKKVVERYDGDTIDSAPGRPRVSAWEMWNEPACERDWLKLPTAYRDSILKVGYNAAKAADPTCIVLNAAIVDCDTPYGGEFAALDTVLSEDGINHLDVIGFHAYYNKWHPNDIVSPYIAKTESVVRILADPNDLPEIWLTETGSYTFSCFDTTTCSCEWGRDSVSLDTQAIYLVEMCAIIDSLYMNPDKLTKRVFFYELKDYPYCSDSNWVPRCGITDENLNPKPAYDSFKVFIKNWKTPWVYSPNGGEDWGIGEYREIQWESKGGVVLDRVDLYYSTLSFGPPPPDDSSWVKIASNEPNDGSYLWIVPSDPSNTCHVKIIAYDTGGKWDSLADISDNDFTIRPLFSTSSYATANNSGRKLVSENTGLRALVYESTNRVLFAKSTNSGQTWSQVGLGDGDVPALARDSYGNFHVVARMPGQIGLVYAKYTTGSGWTSFIPLVGGEPGWDPTTYSPPSLAVDTTFAHLVWERFVQEEGTSLTSYTLWYGKFDTRDSIPVLNPLELLDSLTTTDPPPPAKSATITLDNEYKPHVVWSRPIGLGKKEIYSKHKTFFDIWTPTENLSGTPTPSLSPFIDYNPSDSSLHVVWEEEITVSDVQIWHRWKKNGLSWDPSITIVSDPLSNVVARSPVMEDYFAFFSQGDSITSTDIYFNQWQPPGWAGVVNFSSTPESSNYPHISITDEHCVPNLHGIWTEGGSPGPFEVRFKTITTGTPCGTGGPQSGGEGTTIPLVFRLFQNSPNPFSSSTKIRYHLPKTSSVTLDIYDLSGRFVRNLIKEEQKGGIYNISWDGRESNGEKVSSGVYFYRLVADTGQGREKTATRKLVLLH